MKQVKKITNIALLNKWMHDDPFRGYRFVEEEVDVEFLTQNELDRFEGVKCHSERLEIIRDVFVFSYHSGLAYIEVHSLN